MKTALRRLLNVLDGIARDHEEVLDTDVREEMGGALEALLFQPQPDAELPQEFGMFSPEGNAAVRRALAAFLADSELNAVRALPSAQQRLDAFQDASVVSDQGSMFDEYFGFRDDYEEEV